MSDTTQVTASKPFASSLTIQGLVVTLVGAFAPQIAAWLHIDAGDVTTIVGDVATLIGVVLAVIGRMRATTSLH